ELFQGCECFFAGKIKGTWMSLDNLEIEGGDLIEQRLRRSKPGGVSSLVAKRLLDGFGRLRHETAHYLPTDYGHARHGMLHKFFRDLGDIQTPFLHNV